MKTDEELITIWNNKENSYKEYWKFERLNFEEKERLFELIKLNKHLNT